MNTSKSELTIKKIISNLSLFTPNKLRTKKFVIDLDNKIETRSSQNVLM